MEQKKKIFPARFNNNWAAILGFKDFVRSNWENNAEGDPMFSLTDRIKNIKKAIRN